MSQTSPPGHTISQGWKRTIRRLAQWAVLFGMWVALSGQIVLEFLVIGAGTAMLAVLMSERLFTGTHEQTFAPVPVKLGWLVRTTLKFGLYLAWLAIQIVWANVHVVYLVLHPRMPIHPSLIEFRTTLITEEAQVVLAQSITLTPGTVTIDASDGKFLVHCLSEKTREGIEDGTIQKRIGQVFAEPWVEKVEVMDIEFPEQVPL